MIIIKAKVDYLRSKSADKTEYVVYPYTLLQAITNENGDNLEDILKNFMVTEFDSTLAAIDHVHTIDLSEIDEAFGLVFRYLDVPLTPRNFRGCSIIYNNELHILSGTNHYKYDNDSWESVSTLPFEFNDGSAIVYNNEIHILNGIKHYKFVDNSWQYVSTLPFDMNFGSAIIYNHEIHILNGTNHYKYNNESWDSVSTLPVDY